MHLHMLPDELLKAISVEYFLSQIEHYGQDHPVITAHLRRLKELGRTDVVAAVQRQASPPKRASLQDRLQQTVATAKAAKAQLEAT